MSMFPVYAGFLSSACTNAFDYGEPLCKDSSTLYWGTGNETDLSCAHCVCDEGWAGVDCGRCLDVSVCPDKVDATGQVGLCEMKWVSDYIFFDSNIGWLIRSIGGNLRRGYRYVRYPLRPSRFQLETSCKSVRARRKYLG